MNVPQYFGIGVHCWYDVAWLVTVESPGVNDWLGNGKRTRPVITRPITAIQMPFALIGHVLYFVWPSHHMLSAFCIGNVMIVWFNFYSWDVFSFLVFTLL